jgi:DNA-binding IclR family transcriptional regulator
LDRRRELERVRARGYAISAEELEPGFVAAGAPVRSADGRVVAAVSVGGPKSPLVPSALAAVAEKLSASADGISGRLGWRASAHPRVAARAEGAR